ncbi:hypothetical protein EMIHUDRAFT_458848 [Emiliania huxleyi CCMP1516]|uniref:Uncharacterized protein n=2 Tax=Emiliania huxleyi TaxID=2903 RepID=A0A0D3J645_EMIH1|nr:hypothetical protein EMIHUDRAFT_458848 [Emiliania huxleyi CCMP1516]EOD18980.1 hypothetical protein EMIHUDRAFT_458848 [Emiliania huxleyi CCMP1516]|eukprot:XP_005771409.1 hypothetical protein EMIHUDRAFT_458848 [Emiliania huxleyi CCMP1516]
MLSPLLVSVGCVDTPAAANVRAWLSAGTTMLPPEALDDKVIFSSEMSTIRGASAYSAAATRWDADAAALLKPYRTSVSRLVPLDGQRVAVRWRAAWDPASLAWAPPLARLLGWEIERFDLDPEVVSNFRWMAIFELFAAALRTRVLRLPAASVEGRAVYCLEEGRCVAHEESLDLVRTADSGRLRNRRAAENIAEFLDVARRPDGSEPEEWAAAVRARVLSGVPGAGALHLEPSEDPSEGVFALGCFALVAACAVRLSAGVIGGEATTEAFGEGGDPDPRVAVCEEIGARRSVDFSQCVSDLF